MAQIPDKTKHTDHIESMLERHRWGDAHVALQEYQKVLDPIHDRRDVEWVEYYKTLCAVELYSGDGTNARLPRALSTEPLSQ